MKKRQFIQLRMRNVRTARAGYVLIILAATILEVVRYPQLDGAGARLRFAISPFLSWNDTYDALRNVLLFAGLGAVWLVTSGPVRLRRALAEATVVGLGLSISVEFLQLFSRLRVASLVDVATNGIGAFSGALLAGMLVATVRSWRGHRTSIGVPLFLLAIAQLGALLGETLSPYFESARVSLPGGPLARLSHAVERASIGEIAPLDIALALPAGAFAAAALIEMGMERVRAAGLAWAAASVLVLIVELIHGVAGIAVLWGAVASRSAGILVGACIIGAIAPGLSSSLSQVDRARAALAATMISAIAWAWRPYVLRPPDDALPFLLHAQWIPLRAAPYTLGLPSVAYVIHLASLGFAVGALLAVWPVRRKGALSYVWPAAWMAGILEVGHAFIVGRLVDLTSFLVVFAGAWLGDAVVRRAGFTRYGSLIGGPSVAGFDTTDDLAVSFDGSHRNVT